MGHTGGTSQASLLTQADFTYLGTCQLPTQLSVPSLSNGAYTPAPGFGKGGPGYLENGGLAYAVVGGEPNLFSTANGLYTPYGSQGLPYRFSVPAISATAPYPTATVIEAFGDPYSLKRVNTADQPDNGNYRGPGGIYIRNNGGTYEYWWSYAPEVYSGASNGCSLGWSILNIGSSSGTGQAAVRFENIDFAGRDGSIVPIPTAWRGLFGNHEMMLWNVGQPSHSNSIDPVGLAFDFPNSIAHLGTVPASTFRNFIGFSFARCTSGSSTNPSNRMQRPSWLPPIQYNFTPDKDPNAGVCTPPEENWANAAYLQYSQSSEAAMQFVFIDTGTKYGVISFNSWILSGSAYTAAAVQCGGMTTGWGVLDPNQLAEIYAGSRAPYNIAYASTWPVQYPVYNYSQWPFQPVVATGCTVHSDPSIGRYRVTYPSAPGYVNVGDFLNVFWGTGNDGAGMQVHEVISPTVFDCCAGQSNPCPAVVDEWTVTGASVGFASEYHYGKVVGACWMPVNPVVGSSNVLAVATDMNLGDGGHRYIHFYQVAA